MSPEQLNDVLDCGNAQEAWQEMVAHFKYRAAQSRDIARNLDRDAQDTVDRAAEARADATNWDELAAALAVAEVSFAKVEKATA